MDCDLFRPKIYVDHTFRVLEDSSWNLTGRISPLPPSNYFTPVVHLSPWPCLFPNLCFESFTRILIIHSCSTATKTHYFSSYLFMLLRMRQAWYSQRTMVYPLRVTYGQICPGVETCTVWVGLGGSSLGGSAPLFVWAGPDLGGPKLLSLLVGPDSGRLIAVL